MSITLCLGRQISLYLGFNNHQSTNISDINVSSSKVFLIFISHSSVSTFENLGRIIAKIIFRRNFLKASYI